MKTKLLAVSGPTGSGKSRLAVHLALQLNGEVISADSMQVYRGMDIGTGKVKKEEMMGIPHHLLDILPPCEEYSLSDYIENGKKAIEEVSSRGKLPILCGGTGLYTDALLAGTTLSEAPGDPVYRAELERLDSDTLWTMLKDVDPSAADATHKNNRKRVIRALEIYRSTGIPKTEWDRRSKKDSPYDCRYILMSPADREALYNAINRRVDEMFNEGLEEEVRRIYAGHPSFTAAQAIGYKEFLPYFEGHATLETVKEKIKQASRNYAKRQMTWFRTKEQTAVCIDPTLPIDRQVETVLKHLARQ